jgi:hypothetical protein
MKIPNWYERLVIIQIDKGSDLSILEKEKISQSLETINHGI